MYTEDLATACMCLKALMFVRERMEQLPTSYPMLNLAMSLACDGYVRDIATECEDGKGGVCHVTTEKLGGIDELIKYFTEAITWLTLECDLAEVCDEEDHVSDSSP